jgi:hypothetical protein
VSKTTESAIALLPVVLLPIIALGGGLRPAYLFEPNVRWITGLVPSQWALEANLRQEVEGTKWPPIGQKATPEELQRHPQIPQNQSKVNAEMFCNSEAEHFRKSYSDAIQPFVPQYVLKCPDDQNEMHENFTTQPVEVTVGDKTYKAEPFRHSFATSVSVLAGMLGLLVAAVLGILRKRDSDPQ